MQKNPVLAPKIVKFALALIIVSIGLSCPAMGGIIRVFAGGLSLSLGIVLITHDIPNSFNPVSILFRGQFELIFPVRAFGGSS